MNFQVSPILYDYKGSITALESPLNFRAYTDVCFLGGPEPVSVALIEVFVESFVHYINAFNLEISVSLAWAIHTNSRGSASHQLIGGKFIC